MPDSPLPPLTAPERAAILYRWGPGSLWQIHTEDGDLDGYVRAPDHAAAMKAAADQGSEGDYTCEQIPDVPEDDGERVELLTLARQDVQRLLAGLAHLGAGFVAGYLFAAVADFVCHKAAAALVRAIRARMGDSMPPPTPLTYTVGDEEDGEP